MVQITTQLSTTYTSDVPGPTASIAAVDCGCPLQTSHAEVDLTSTTAGSVAEYRCKNGFQSASGAASLTCGSDGEWKGTPPSCEAITPCIRPCGYGSCFVDDDTQKCDCFTGYGFFGRSQFCLDVNECENGLDFCMGRPACAPNARCTNSPYGSYTCRCPSGYTGDGRTACEDENECLSAPCSKFANCTNTAGSYTCQCLDGYVGSGIVCTEINECNSNPCNNIGGTCVDRINGYNCSCREGFAGDRCDININDCEPSPCLNNGACSDRINAYSCDCVDGWEGSNCEKDINECTFDPCNRNADCTNTNGSFTCTCKQGSHGDGFECTETDECFSSPCQNGADCIDGLNKYTCDCPNEWQGETCEEDVNECLLQKCHKNSACTNSPGSYTCTCHEGFYGNDLTQKNLICREIILFPYGEEQGDTSLPDTNQHKDISLPTLIEISVGFPFFGEFYYSLYFSDNGLIVFPPTAQSRARREPFPNPSPFSSDHTVQAGFPPMIAASWGDVDLTTDVGKVWYQVYTDDNSVDGATQAMLDMVTERMNQYFSDAFVPTWVLVVTWDSVPSVEATYTKQNPNTYQAVLATDWSDSVAFLTFKEDEMLWTNETQSVVLGYNSANGANFENIQLANPYRPDQVNGNTGLKGRWAFKLESDATRKTNFKKLCRDWYNAEPEPSEWIDGEGQCPCTLLQALRDHRFTPVTLSPSKIPSILASIEDSEVCLSPLFASPSGSSVDCCFKFLALNTEIPLAGSHHRYQRFSQRELNIDFDESPKSWCCTLSDDEAFCNMYYEKRPPNSCSSYVPLRLAITWGDPHMKTFDGLAYTFNGLGEFTLVKTSGAGVQFRVQGRTEKAIGTQGAAEATVFTAYASKQWGSSTVEMGLTEDRTNMTLMVDGQYINITDLQHNGAQRFANVTLQYNFNSNRTSVIATFSSGVTVTVTPQKFMLNVEIGSPESLENTTRGLLGVWNGNILDDFTYPNGTVLQPPDDRNLTEEEIFPWGLSWQISQDESLFTYKDGQDATSFANPDFRPKFLSQLRNTVPGEKQSEAEDLCGSNVECLFDFLSTNDTEVGEQTKSSIETFDSDAEKLANFPPNITVNATVNGVVGQVVELQATAKDPEDNPVTYSIGNVNAIPGATINPVTGFLSWRPTSLLPVQLEIVARDDRGASSSSYPMVKLCDCKNGGTCNFVTVDFTGEFNPVGQFQVVTCSCPEAYTGEFCDDDKDECEEDPCYPGVVCTDNVAPAAGFTCGPCPTGLSGTGEKCFDINECIQGQICEQPHNCENTRGSYICGCDFGYNVDSNGLDCNDIDECALGTAGCSDLATCTNTEGSFICSCNAGYFGNGTYCEDIDECAITSSCDRNAVCDNTVGSYKCTCKAGYEGSGRKCEDTNECDQPDTCHTHAECTNNIGSYSCSCSTGYRGNGAVCTNVDECDELLDSCLSGLGICIDNPGSYSCACRGGYVGDGVTCEDLNECSDDALNNCTENAHCTNTEGSYICLCAEGYDGIGSVSCMDVDECTNDINNCAQEATCTNTPGSYLCSCNEWFAGNGVQCEDIDECVRGEDDCDDDTKAVCTNLIGGYNCTCYNGYEGDGRNCTDIDECLTDNDKCSDDCFNTEGSYTCRCKDGYRLAVDGFNCNDIDECAEEVDDCEQVCTNTEGGFNCSCASGFTHVGDSCQASQNCTSTTCKNAACFVDVDGDNRTEKCLCFSGYKFVNEIVCEDIDECSSDTRNACDQLCNNTDGGYRCDCYRGFMIGTDDRTCTDIDECVDNELNVCDPNALCDNNQGGYTCSCRQGYTGNGTFCTDYDECTFGSHAQNCSDSAQCVNFDGGFSCSCRAGYIGDGFFCADVDECMQGSQKCHEQATCTNALGSFTCSCNEGFNEIGAVCEDIDECENGMSLCDGNSTCTNNAGSFICTCNDGYTGKGSTCTDVNECLSGQASCHGQASCRNTEGSYVCTCNAGYTGSGTDCKDEDECAEDKHTCTENSVCVNTVGSFNCPCKPGYIGSSCVDVRECEEDIDNCDDNANCTNTPGSFSCTCHSDYVGNGTVCTEITVTTEATTVEFESTAAPTTRTRMTVTAGPPKPRKFVPAQITMDRDFKTEYKDPDSHEYMELSSQLKSSLSIVYSGIQGSIEIIIIRFVPGSVQARYAAVFTVEGSEPDSFIQQAARTNLQRALDSGTFDSDLQVTSSDSLQSITLSKEELDQVSCDLPCGEGGVCARSEPYPGAVVAECQCEENYCYTGTCEFNVQEGRPRCNCPAIQGAWYSGERCQVSLTEADLIGIAAGCACAVLVIVLLVVVCMAKRSRRLAKKRRQMRQMRYRVDAPAGTLANLYGLSDLNEDQDDYLSPADYVLPLESWIPLQGLPVTDLSEDQDDYLSPVPLDADMIPIAVHTESLRARGRSFWNPSVANVPSGEIKIPRPSVKTKTHTKDDKSGRFVQTFEFKF